MLLDLTAVFAGFVLLAWGADRFVTGAAALAANLGVAPLLIGLTIVGFGTSAPEMLVSGVAAWQGNAGLAIGNAIGSNLANIGLVIAVTALISPLTVHSDTLRREFPLLMVVSLLAFALLWDQELGQGDGLLLLLGLVLTVILIVRIGQERTSGDPLAAEVEAELPPPMSTALAGAWFALGLLILLGSSRLLVWGAVNLATTFGVSDLVIGLTIVAIGTSLPELAASIASAVKGEHDIAIGNVIGSNLYNLLGVLALPGLLHPGTVDATVLYRDLPVMLVLTSALFLMSQGRPGRINRWEGSALLAVFLAYQGWIIAEVTGQL